MILASLTTAKRHSRHAMYKKTPSSQTMMALKKEHSLQSNLQATATNWQPLTTSIARNHSMLKEYTSSDASSDDIGAIRYVNVRVALPDAPPEYITGYVQSTLQRLQQSNMSNKTETNNRCGTAFEPYRRSVQNVSFDHSNRATQYAFIPISCSDNGAFQPYQSRQDMSNLRENRTSSTGASSSPQKDGKCSPSPSLVTLETEDMTELSYYSNFSTPASSRNCSPDTVGFVPSPPLFTRRNLCASTTSFQTNLSCGSTLLSTKLKNMALAGRRSPSCITVKTSSNKVNVPTTSVDDDEVRKCRIKTEMCMHYVNGTFCPFGENCTYAHGEEELQMTKLIDLHEAGLVDMDTYRTKPCLTWVATGSCPFGKRCTCIHDPRVGGFLPSWLPHTETQGNTIATDINVESLHQKRLNTILYSNPFGIEELSPIDEIGKNRGEFLKKQWNFLYNLVTDSDSKYNSEGWMLDTKQRRCGKHVHPIIKLEVAIKMREASGCDWHYKYRPEHFIFNEFCMVLSKKAFRIINNEQSKKKTRNQRNVTKSNKDMEVLEIPISSYNPNYTNHLIAREIAFGPDCDPAVKGVSLWFHINEEDVSVCTPQQAKRFRWKKGMKHNKSESVNDNDEKGEKSAFDLTSGPESFPMIRPQDPDAYNLVTEILKHRLSVLRAERLSNMKDRFESLKSLEVSKKFLEERFISLHRSWGEWSWPTNVGRNSVNRNTPVPPVDAMYQIDTEKSHHKGAKINDLLECRKDNKVNYTVGSSVKRLWESFVTTIPDENTEPDTSTDFDSVVEYYHDKKHDYKILDADKPTHKRLSVFKQLSNGHSIDRTNRSIPNINFSYNDHMRKSKTKQCYCQESSNSASPQRCWEALLLDTQEDLGDAAVNENSVQRPLKTEWDLVLDHFENSRCKKVLTIIQQ